MAAYLVTDEDAATILVAVGGVAAVVAFLWGMAVGRNDARLQVAVQQAEAIAACEREGDLALRDLRTGVVTCFTSSRVAGQ